MTTESCVSVIIPTYNRARFLPTAIKSVLAQSHPNVEIIVVDDGSTDDTKTVLEPFRDKIRYLATEHRGTAYARNIGMKTATGKYIAFLDSDDRYLPYKLETQVSFIENHPEVGMVYTEFSGSYNDEYIDEYHLRTYHDIYERNGWAYEDLFPIKGEFSCDAVDEPITYYIGDIFQYNLMDTVVPSNTILFPRKILETVGFQNEAYRLAQDYEFVVRICKQFQVAFLNIPTYVLLHHAGQASGFHKKDKSWEENLLTEIEAGKILLNIVLDWGYKDKQSYDKYQEVIDSRLAEVFRLIGVRWLAFNDLDKARECFQSSYSFEPVKGNYLKFRWLFFIPGMIRRYIIRLFYM